jgi:hypothetical protein
MNGVFNSTHNSVNFQALQFNLEQNKELLIHRLSSLVLQVFDRIAEDAIQHALNKADAEEDINVDDILIVISDALNDPGYSAKDVSTLYDKASQPSKAAKSHTFHFITDRHLQSIALDQVLFHAITAHRYLMLWSKDCEDHEIDAEQDILNPETEFSEKKSAANEKQQAIKTLMLEFIELCLFHAKLKFIDRTGLFYAKNPTIYESDQFIVQQQQIVRDSIQCAFRDICFRSFQMSILVPFRKIITPTALLQQLCEQSKRSFSALTQAVATTMSSSSQNKASSSSSSNGNIATELHHEIHGTSKLLKTWIEENKAEQAEETGLLRSLNQCTEELHQELLIANKTLQKSHEIHTKHYNNVAEDLHSLLQLAENQARAASKISHHNPVSNNNITVANPSSSSSGTAPQNSYLLVTTPSGQSQHVQLHHASLSNKSREGEPDSVLYEYKQN